MQSYHKISLLSIVSILILLTACASSPVRGPIATSLPDMPTIFPTATPSPSGDALKDLADAQVTMWSAQTAQADAQRRILEATENARATENAWVFGATATAQAWQYMQLADGATATAQARVIESTARARAWEISGTAQARAWEATATTQAITIAQVRAEEEKRGRADAQSTYVWWLFILILFAFIIGLAVIILKMFAEWAWVRVQRAGVFESTQGLILTGRARDVTVLPRAPIPPALPPGVAEEQAIESEFFTQAARASGIPYRVNGKLQGMVHLQPTEEEKAARLLCLRLLRATIMQCGPGATRIPTAKDLGWASETWQRAVHALKPSGAIIAKTGRAGGTFITGYSDARALYDALGSWALRPSAPTFPQTINTP